MAAYIETIIFFMHRIYVVGTGPFDLATKLKEGGVDCSILRQRAGQIMNDAGAVIEVAKFTIPALAGILVAWVNTRPTRKLTITTEDKKVIHAEGKSVEEVENLIGVAQSIMAVAPNERTQPAEQDVGERRPSL